MAYPQEVDIGLQKFVARRRLSAAQAQHLVVAVEKLWPGTKYKLPYTHGQLSAVSHMQLAQHTLPLPWNCALGLAHWMATAGRPRLGSVFLHQLSAGLRPMEVPSLQTPQLTRPDENPTGNLGIITLAPERGTKVGRPLAVLLWPDHVRTSEELTKAAAQVDVTARGLIVRCIVPGPICVFCRSEITRSQGIEECRRCYAGPFHVACYRYHLFQAHPVIVCGWATA